MTKMSLSPMDPLNDVVPVEPSAHLRFCLSFRGFDALIRQIPVSDI